MHESSVALHSKNSPQIRTDATFDFCNKVCHKPTSAERNETNTLSVEAHPRNGESVEAKGMPEVK
jgi:hypothetical protein